MGTNRKVLSEEDKLKFFGPERNARRRERYATDPAYAERERERARLRSEKKLDPKEDPRRWLPHLAAQADPLDVIVSEKGEGANKVRETRMVMGFTTERVADLLGRRPSLLYRWRQAGKLPHGVLFTTVDTGNKTQVYTVDEVAVILQTLGDHFEKTPYYQDQHVDTRDTMFRAIEKVRSQSDVHPGQPLARTRTRPATQPAGA